MDFPEFGGDATRRLLDAVVQRGTPEADNVIRRAVATLLAAQQAATEEATAAFDGLDAARRTCDQARIARARDHAAHSYERARGLSREVDMVLRRLLVRSVPVNRSLVPQLQAAGAASMAATAELELRAMSHS